MLHIIYGDGEKEKCSNDSYIIHSESMSKVSLNNHTKIAELWKRG